MFASLEQLAAERRRRREARSHDLRRQRDEREWMATQRVPRLREVVDELAGIPKKLADIMMNPVLRGNPDELKSAKELLLLQGRRLMSERDQLLVQNGFGVKFLEVWWDCEKCQDTGVIEHRYDDGTFDPPEKCDCVRKEELEDLLVAAGLVGPLGEQSFENWDPLLIPEPYRRNMAKIYQFCHKFAQEVAGGKARRGLVLMGPTGVGKTFMCAAISRLVAQGLKAVAYITMSEFMEFARRARFDRDSGDLFSVYERILESPLLVLDDVGIERVSEFTQEEFFNVVNFRVNRGLPIVISSNYTPAEFDSKYGERIASRLFTFCDVLPLEGEDLRRVKRMQEAEA